jgi:ADP-ribose pyrophosphatase YjhB (NUDIX family)
MKYRVSAKGLLHKNGKVLFIEYSDHRGPYYSLPGGGQEKGESLHDTLVREMKEEVGLDVEVGELALVREFILQTSEIEGWEQGIHQVEVVFRCTLRDESQQAEIGQVPDTGMMGIRWIEVGDLHNHIIYPTSKLKELIETGKPTYLLA